MERVRNGFLIAWDYLVNNLGLVASSVSVLSLRELILPVSEFYEALKIKQLPRTGNVTVLKRQSLNLFLPL